MGTYIGNNADWINNVYTFEETDPVQGGEDGIDNVPIKNLADRTAWLKAQIGRANRLEDDVVIVANASIPAALAGNLIVGYCSGVAKVLTLTLEDVSTFPHGSLIPIAAFCEPAHVVKIVTTGANKISNPVSGDRSVMYMHHNEQLFLVALTDHFKVITANGNFYCVGEEVKARKIINNTLALNGQILKREEFPRLWEYVSSFTLGQEIVNEFTWFSDLYLFRGCFSNGDGLTTFRLPDERGMFERMLDSGRGVDLYRTHNYAGGYEKDYLQDHIHDVNLNPNANSQGGFGKVTTGSDGPEGLIPIIKSGGPKDYANNLIGAGETIVKNIAKFNLIKF